MAKTDKKPTRTTTITIDEEMVEALSREAEATGVIGWSRMLVILAKEGLVAREKRK
jgi:hypothetical protein